MILLFPGSFMVAADGKEREAENWPKKAPLHCPGSQFKKLGVM